MSDRKKRTPYVALGQASGIVLDSLANTYATQIKHLRAHCISRGYPMALLNTITILDLIVQTNHLPSIWKALSILERVNTTLESKPHPKLADLQELAYVADEARKRGRV